MAMQHFNFFMRAMSMSRPQCLQIAFHSFIGVTGANHYLYVVYKQVDRIDVDEVGIIDNKTAAGRGEFNIAQFVEQYNLDGPIAGNFYMVRLIIAEVTVYVR